MRSRSFIQAFCCTLLLCGASTHAQSSRSVALQVTIAPECAVGVVALVNQGSPGDATTQTLSFNYKVRTAASGGQGQILLRFASIGSESYPKGGSVDYQTQLEGPGVPLSGSTTFSNAVTSGIVIARLGSQASSIRTGATGKVQFSVAPAVPSGLLQPVLSISCQ